MAEFFIGIYARFTELGILYAKHKKGKLMDFVKSNTSRLNIPKLIRWVGGFAPLRVVIFDLCRACEANFLWKEAVYLYVSYDEYDSAANTIIQHSPTAWSQVTGLSGVVVGHCVLAGFIPISDE